MAVTLPPIPQRVPMIDDKGIVSQPWSKWFLYIFERAGGVIAPSNNEIDLSSLTATVSSLNTTVSSHTITLASLQQQIDDLQKGRVL